MKQIGFPTPEERMLQGFFRAMFAKVIIDSYPRSDYLLKEKEYIEAFNKHSKKTLEDVLKKSPKIDLDKKTLWLIEHLVETHEEDPIFLVDRDLSTFANYGDLVIPFSKYALEREVSISIISEGKKINKQNPIFELLEFSDLVFLHYLSQDIPEDIAPNQDFGICGYDAYVGEPPKNKRNIEAYTVADSLSLWKDLIAAYKDIIKQTGDYRKLITRNNLGDI